MWGTSACPAVCLWVASESRSPFLVVLSTWHSCLVWACSLTLLSLFSRTQNASGSVQDDKYQRKITRPSKCLKARSFGILFPSLHSLSTADFPSYDPLKLMQYLDYFFRKITSGHTFSSHTLFHLPCFFLLLVSWSPTQVPSSRLDGRQVEIPRPGNYGNEIYNQELKNVQVQDFCFTTNYPRTWLAVLLMPI